MFLALDADEREIANAAESFVQGELPVSRLHDEPGKETDYEAFAQLGWFGLAASESSGGSGLSIVEEMLFFRELGKVLGPVDVLAQILAVTLSEDNPNIVSGLLSGEAKAVLIAQLDNSDNVILLGSTSADYAVHVLPHSATLYSFDGAGAEKIDCLDPGTQMHRIVKSSLREVARCASDAVWRKAQVDVSAMMIGQAQAATDMIVEYAKERETFGRKIGAYQAVRHPCADMASRVELSTCQLFYAATALKENQGDAPVQIDAAYLLAQRAALENAETNIQLHGGIGVTEELSAHLYLKRAHLLNRLFGHSKSAITSLLDAESVQKEL